MALDVLVRERDLMHIRAGITSLATTAFLASLIGPPALVAPSAAASCTITGTAGSDTLSGTGGNDVICGQGGADTLSGRGGDDTLIGGSGNDTLVGGAGSDTLTGSAGNDSLTGADGNDSLNGGTGADTMTGGSGVDTATYASSTTPVVADLDGATGDDGTTGEQDTLGSGIEGITGGSAADELTGSTAANTITGGSGDDTLSGGSGTDTLSGGSGSDTLEGGAGGDTLSGSGGSDTAAGGPGTDTLSLGSGSDEVADATGGATVSGGESCTAADQDLEIAVGCASVGGYGQYGRASVLSPHDLDTNANSSGLFADQPDLGMHAGVLLDGSTVIGYKDTSGNPVVTKVLPNGVLDTSFGDNGWVTDLSERAGQAQVVSRVSGLIVIGGQAFVMVKGEVTYMVKIDATGNIDPAFGDGGILDLGPALGFSSCRLCGFYPLQAFGDRLMVSYTQLTGGNGDPFTWSHGFAELNPDTGATVSNSVDTGLIDGDLPRAVLPLPDGSVLRQSHTGAVFKQTSAGEADTAFGSDGVLAPPVFDTTGNRGINSTELLPAADGGFARVTVVGILEPLGPGGVPKIYETQPHEVIVETFDATGQPVTIGDNDWDSTVVKLPPGVEECDSAADPANLPTSVLSLNGDAAAVDMLTVQRCSDDLWVTLLPDGTATIERRDRGNFRGTPGTVVDNSGRLLIYGTGAALTLERLPNS